MTLSRQTNRRSVRFYNRYGQIRFQHGPEAMMAEQVTKISLTLRGFKLPTTPRHERYDIQERKDTQTINHEWYCASHSHDMRNLRRPAGGVLQPKWRLEELLSSVQQQKLRLCRWFSDLQDYALELRVTSLAILGT